MTSSSLMTEIDTFEKMLPSLRSRLGSAWAVIVGQDCKGGFPDFSSAASYAVEHFQNSEYLIRHTDNCSAQIPFVAVEGE